MPLKLRFGKAKKYDVSSKNAYLVCVRLLDNGLMECTLTSDSTGQECLENIAQRINLSQTDYFGLGYVNKKLHFRWLDLQRPIKKQLDKYSSTPLIYFGVMFYIPQVHRVKDAMIRYQFYLQLKSDVIEGKLRCTQEQAVMLASYSVQAEFGHFDSSRHNVDFYKGYVLLPKTLALDDASLHGLNQEICNQHHKLQGVPPQEAELQYIIEAQQLKEYGSEYYPAKDDSSHDIHLGVSFQGVLLKTLTGTSEQFFKWVDIKKVLHNKKNIGFEIFSSVKAVQTDSNTPSKRVQCNFEGLETAKYVFKMCSLQHQFYHLMHGNDIGKEAMEESPVISEQTQQMEEETKEVPVGEGTEDLESNNIVTQFHSTDPETPNNSLQMNSSDPSEVRSESYTQATVPYDTGQYTSLVKSGGEDATSHPVDSGLSANTENVHAPGIDVTAIKYMTENYTALHHTQRGETDQQEVQEKVITNKSPESLNIRARLGGYVNTIGEASSANMLNNDNSNRPKSAVYEHSSLQAVASDGSSVAMGNGYLAKSATEVQVPEYRVVPNYQTVMQQRMLYMSQQQQQQQQQQSLETAQNKSMLHSSGTLAPVQVTYSQPENTLSYRQPAPQATGELVGPTPPTYQQYLSQPPRTSVLGGTSLQYSRSFLDTNPAGSHGNPHIRAQGQYGKPVDRHNSLIIHPTYTTHRDIYFPAPSNQFSNSEIILREFIAKRPRPANPYRLGSSSTPDLASQHMSLNVASSTELVTPKYLSNGNLVNQSQLDQSVENLALDATRLQLHQHLASKSKRQLAEEQSSSEQIAYSGEGGLGYGQHVMLQSQDSLNQQPQHLHQQLHPQQPHVILQGQDSLSHQQPQHMHQQLQQQPAQYLSEHGGQAYNVYGPGYRHDGRTDDQEVFINTPPHANNSHSPPNYHPLMTTPFAPNQMFYTGNAEDLINQKSKAKEHIYQNLPPTHNKQEYGEENPYENLPSALIGLQEERFKAEEEGSSAGNSFDKTLPEVPSTSLTAFIQHENSEKFSEYSHDVNAGHSPMNSDSPRQQKTSLSTPIPLMDAEALEHIKSPSFRGANTGQQTVKVPDNALDSAPTKEDVTENALMDTNQPEAPNKGVPGLVKGGLVDQLVSSSSSHFFENGMLQPKANGSVVNGETMRLPSDSAESSTAEQRGSTTTEYEDADASPKNLQKAALSGLSLSRANMIEMNDNELRAPKDERRRALESKLEEGQVFAEFEDIPKMKSKCDCTVASQEDNKEKNRFKDVLPYDSNRVKLTPRKENKTGYINASHIKITVDKHEFWYIAAQGPKSNTVVDFWQMMWEQEVQVIAMLTDLIEIGKEKCHRYWPEEAGPKNGMKFGDYQVTLKFTNDSGGFLTRGLILRHCKLKRERFVWHLQYPDWQDHGCPDDTYGFLAYLDEIESVRRHSCLEDQDKHKTPVLVHCSAGVGRSGVVILAEVMKACLEHNQDLDIATVLSRMRLQRMYLVQTVSQYTFVYKTLVTYLKSSRLI